MPIEILMPALSPTMTAGNLAKWLKKEGDKVKPGDVIAEIETDKATMEVEAVDEGVLAKILVAAGSNNVTVNSLIALLLEEDEKLESIENYTPKNNELPQKQEVKNIKVDTSVITKNNQPSDRIKASPLAKRIAENEKIDLREIQGSGPHGRIVKADLLNKPAKQSFAITAEDTHIPHSNIRRVIATRLQESKQTVPHFYLSAECNIDKLLQIRSEMNLDAENFKLSINDFIIKAVAMALQENPEANASWGTDSVVRYGNVDISVAVAIDDGLITPIIRSANTKSISNISNEMKELAARAKKNGLKPEEFQGGGFSISNLGMFGIKNFQAIINPPQACILAVGMSNKRPVVINDQLAIATIMDVSLSCDHRVVDGAVGAKFIASFKKFIENPVKMFA